jgi:hypothetical protein
LRSDERAESDTQSATLKAFLEEAPPLVRKAVTADIGYHHESSSWFVKLPPLSLFCDSSICDGERFFDPVPESIDCGGSGEPEIQFSFAHYYCRHCRVSLKLYALALLRISGPLDKLDVIKIGEQPPAIGPTPRALQDLLGDQWALYLQGRRSELAGLGIGAFVYYRRTIEHVWKRVLERLIEVARLDNSSARVAALAAVRAEQQFTRSMEMAKGAIPVSLYVDGHNPFQALYDACGDGLHEYTDEECIRRSRIIRLVLGRFAERAKSILAEDAEFRQAVGSLAASTTDRQVS